VGPDPDKTYEIRRPTVTEPDDFKNNFSDKGKAGKKLYNEELHSL
jgi:hypothetical protein